MPDNFITPEIIEGFERSEYRVYANEQALVLRPGSRSDLLRDLLKAHDVKSCGLITAYRPYLTNFFTSPATDEENYLAQQRLEKRLTDKGYLLRAERINADGSGTIEPWLCALGISFKKLANLSFSFRQHVFLYGDETGQFFLVPNLNIPGSPGRARWTRRPDQTFYHTHALLGGIYAENHDAAAAAEKLGRIAENKMSALKPALQALGWEDVIKHLETLERRAS